MIDRFRLLLEDPHETAKSDPGVFDNFIPYALSIVDSDPAAGKPLVEVILKHAPTPCQRVLGWGLWAQIHRAIGDLDEADRAIEQAFYFADGCEPCVADLHRRRAALRRNRRQWGAAIEDADKAVRRYLQLGHPGHNLHGNGLASSYNVRATIRFYMDDPDGAATDEREALAILDPRVSPVLYRTVITNLASALQATGCHSDLLEAARYLKKARRLFKGVRKCSQERAKLDWLTAQVRYKLGKGRPCELREMMERSQSDFRTLGFPLESVAVASDLMKMKLARSRWGQGSARDLCRDIVADLLDGLPQPKLPTEVVTALHQIAAEAELCGWHAKDQLKASVDQLREACGPKMMACLLTWETA